MADQDDNLRPNWLDDSDDSENAFELPQDYAEGDLSGDDLSFAENENAWPTQSSEGEVPDWLAELGPQYTQPETMAGETPDAAPSAAPQAQGDDTDWLEQQFAQQAASQPGLPDDLRDNEPETEAEEPEFEWMSALGDDSDEDASSSSMLNDETIIAEWAPQPPSAGDSPTEPDPLSFDAASEEGEFEWLSDPNEKVSETAAPDATPDWVGQLGTPARETENSAEPGTERTEQVSDWSNDFVSSTDQDAPDWLNALEGSDQDEEAEQPESPEWATSLGDEEDLELANENWVSAVGASSTAQSAPDEEDSFEWVSEFEQDEVEAAAASSTGAMAWTEESEEDDEAVAGEMPDWLTELGHPAADAEPATAETPEAAADATEDEEATPAWMSGGDDEFALNESEEEPTTAETPDWLSELQAGDSKEAPVSQPTSNVSGMNTGELSNWLDDLVGTPQAETSAEASDENEFAWEEEFEPTETPPVSYSEITVEDVEAEEEALYPAEWPEDEFDSELQSAEPVESYSPEPAENAPDWLNAMVPGVELDFEASEDEVLEEDFVAQEPTPAPTTGGGDFGWLSNIVEQETNPASLAAAMSAGAREPRFVFSKPPAWLRDDAPTETRSADSDSDWDVVSSDDIDLPDWLK